MIRRTIALVTSLATGCLPTVLPQPAAPAEDMPQLTAAAAPAGKGQIAIAADEPARVERVVGHAEGSTPNGWPIDADVYETVCPATPCVANLELGDTPLRFTSLVDPNHTGTGTISVGETPTNYRYALGHNVGPTSGWIGAFIPGVMGVATGIALIAIGQTTTLDDHANVVPGPDLVIPGVITLVVGAALTALGCYWWSRDRGAIQEGIGVQWTPNAP